MSIRNQIAVIGLLVALAGGSGCAPLSGTRQPCAARITLATHGHTSYVITLAREHSPAEQFAAAELARYLKEITGTEFSVVTPIERGGRPTIAVGPGAARSISPNLSLAGLGTEGIVLRTCGRHVIITGGPGAPRGTLYAVCHFLDNILGVRWWAKDATFVPRKPELNIEPLDVVQRPAFELRGELSFACVWDQDWSAHNRINRMCYATWDPDFPANTAAVFSLDEKHGGGIDFPMPGQKNVHTFYFYLPVDKYFDAHPEWFAEIDGKRTKEGQPCLTNPEVLKVITEAVLEDLRKNPKALMVSVSQCDAERKWCHCANCRQLDEAEGSPAGSLLRFVNAVAERVGKERPDVLVETLAYEDTLTPPNLTRPHANVVIRFCGSYHVNFFHSFDAPENAGFIQNLRGWSAISPHLYLFDYLGAYLHPYPSLRSMGPNLRILAKYGVKGYMVGYCLPPTEFAELRTWVLSRMLWNPSLDDQALISDFVNGYYGAAGRYVLDYINLVHDAAAKGECILYYGGEKEPSPFVTFEVMSKAETLFRQAEQAVAGDADCLQHVRRLHMSVQYVWAVNRDVWADGAKRMGLPPPPPAVDFFEALRRQMSIEEAGVPKNQQRYMETFLASVKKEMEMSPLKLATKASSSYASQPYMAFDGDPETAWMPGGTGGWIQRDMGKSVRVKAIRTFFGYIYTHVTYQIEASLDEKAWTPMIPRKTSEGNRVEDHPAAATEARYLRTTIFSASYQGGNGAWVGIQEQTIEPE